MDVVGGSTAPSVVARRSTLFLAPALDADRRVAESFESRNPNPSTIIAGVRWTRWSLCGALIRCLSSELGGLFLQIPNPSDKHTGGPRDRPQSKASDKHTHTLPPHNRRARVIHIRTKVVIAHGHRGSIIIVRPRTSHVGHIRHRDTTRFFVCALYCCVPSTQVQFHTTHPVSEPATYTYRARLSVSVSHRDIPQKT